MSAFVAYGLPPGAMPPPAGASTGTAPNSLALKPRLDTTQAGPLAAALLARRGAPLAVDASAVQHLGAQCAQVLLSARLTWAKDGHDFEIKPMSDAFGASLRLLGLSDELGTESA